MFEPLAYLMHPFDRVEDHAAGFRRSLRGGGEKMVARADALIDCLDSSSHGRPSLAPASRALDALGEMNVRGDFFSKLAHGPATQFRRFEKTFLLRGR